MLPSQHSTSSTGSWLSPRPAVARARGSDGSSATQGGMPYMVERLRKGRQEGQSTRRAGAARGGPGPRGAVRCAPQSSWWPGCARSITWSAWSTLHSQAVTVESRARPLSSRCSTSDPDHRLDHGAAPRSLQREHEARGSRATGGGHAGGERLDPRGLGEGPREEGQKEQAQRAVAPRPRGAVRRGCPMRWPRRCARSPTSNGWTRCSARP